MNQQSKQTSKKTNKQNTPIVLSKLTRSIDTDLLKKGQLCFLLATNPGRKNLQDSENSTLTTNAKPALFKMSKALINDEGLDSILSKRWWMLDCFIYWRLSTILSRNFGLYFGLQHFVIQTIHSFCFPGQDSSFDKNFMTTINNQARIEERDNHETC